MGIKQDWLERQIEAIGDVLAVALFGKNKLKKVFENEKENQETDFNKEMETMLLEACIKSYLKNEKFVEAENQIFSIIENNRSAKNLSTALLFYNELLKFDNDYLQKHDFSKEKINAGINKLKELYD